MDPFNFYIFQNYQKNKCDLKTNLINNNCSINAIETNEISSAFPTQYEDFTNYTESGNTVQIRPQRFKVKLRKGTIISFFVQAKN